MDISFINNNVTDDDLLTEGAMALTGMVWDIGNCQSGKGLYVTCIVVWYHTENMVTT